MMWIPLTQGKWATVDNDMYDELSKFKWYAAYNQESGKWYARRWNGNGRSLLMHREIIKPPSDLYVDHINGDGLDNRSCNLRICTNSQNQQNSAKQRRATTSKYKGVSWSSQRKKWVAHINISGKRVILGRFDSEEDAARAYDERAKIEYGEFAKLNLKD